MAMIVLAIALGALIGLSLGMLGGGGSILTVPAPVYVLGQDAHAAVGVSLVIVGMNAFTGAWLHQRAGHARRRAARLSRLLPSPMLLVLFALLMIVVAALMLRGSGQPQHLHAAPIVSWELLLGGATTGFLTGFLGSEAVS